MQQWLQQLKKVSNIIFYSSNRVTFIYQGLYYLCLILIMPGRMLLNQSVELRNKSRAHVSDDKLSGGRKRPRLRSRNSVIDSWLDGENDGNDAFADLEDFLVDE